MQNIYSLLFLLVSPFFGYGQKADSLHNASLVIDTHNDVLISSIMEGKDITKNVPGGHTDIPRLFKGGVNGQFFSVWCGPEYGKGKAFAYANRQIDSLMSIIHHNPDEMMLATSKADILKAAGQHKIAAFIGVEGGHMIEDNLTYVDSLYKRGVRYLTLTWNNSTKWATSASDENNPKLKLKHEGLSEFGKELVHHMNELGMMVDLSHVGRQTFFDAIEASSKPIIVSHSNAYTIAPVSRNLKDDQIRAVAKNGGVICVNFYSAFLDENFNKKRDQLFFSTVPENQQKGVKGDNRFYKLSAGAKEQLRPPLSKVIDNIDYIVNLIGVDYVGIGGDFDGVESTAKGLDDVSSYPAITKALIERGYNEKDIQKILGANVLRVLEAQ